MIKKSEIIKEIIKILEEKEADIQAEILSLEVEIGSESKNPAGDKYETSREMMNQSLHQLSKQLNQLQMQRNHVESLHGSTAKESINLGSLVKTNEGYFLFGLSLGKIQFENNNIFVLSLNSPIGKEFFGKKTGEKVRMNQKEYHIQSIS